MHRSRASLMGSLTLRTLLAIALVVISAFIAVSAASPARASTASLAAYPGTANWGICPSRNTSGVLIIACVYADADGKGTAYLMGSDLGCRNLTGLVNQVSSVISQSWNDYVIELYAGPNCQSPQPGRSYSVELRPGERFNLPCCGFAGFGDLWNDDMESWKITGTDGNELFNS